MTITIEISEREKKHLDRIVEDLKKGYKGNPFDTDKTEIDRETALKVAITETYKQTDYYKDLMRT